MCSKRDFLCLLLERNWLVPRSSGVYKPSFPYGFLPPPTSNYPDLRHSDCMGMCVCVSTICPIYPLYKCELRRQNIRTLRGLFKDTNTVCICLCEEVYSEIPSQGCGPLTSLTYVAVDVCYSAIDLYGYTFY